MIPAPEASNVIRDSYIMGQFYSILEQIDDLYAVTDKLSTKQARIQSLSINLSKLFKDADSETLAHLTRQNEEIWNIKLYLYNLHTFVIKNTKAKPDDIEELTQLLDNLSIQ